MKILITGSNGLLGQKLVQHLSNLPDVDFLATSRGKNRILTLGDFAYQPMDVTDQKDVLKVVSDYKPDALIHTAAMTNVDACETAQAECRKLNVDAVEYLIEACLQNKTHLIHLSTDFVFDGEDGPYKEQDDPCPLSYYGQSKYDAEQLLMNSGLEHWSIARTIIVYGVVEDMSRSNIVLWAKGALEKGDPLKIVNDQFRSPTLAEDLADGCVRIALRKANGIFHLSGKDYMSIIELVQRVATHFGLSHENVTPVSSSFFETAAKRPPRTGFVLDKARKVLDYNPHSFEEGLEILQQQLAR